MKLLKEKKKSMNAGLGAPPGSGGSRENDPVLAPLPEPVDCGDFEGKDLISAQIPPQCQGVLDQLPEIKEKRTNSEGDDESGSSGTPDVQTAGILNLNKKQKKYAKIATGILTFAAAAYMLA